MAEKIADVHRGTLAASCALLFSLGLVFSSCTSSTFPKNSSADQEANKLASSTEPTKDLIAAFKIENQGFDKFKDTAAPATAGVLANTELVKVPEPLVEKKVKTKKISAAKAKKEESAMPLAPADPVAAMIPDPGLKLFEHSANEYPAEYPEQLKVHDNRSAEVWKKFRPNIFPGEVSKFAIKYLGVTCGIITLKTLPSKFIGSKKVYHLSAHMKSAPFYRYFYTVDDTLVSFVEEKTFLPLKYTLIQRESGQNVDDLQLFDHDKLKGHYWFERLKKGELTKNQDVTDIPKYFQDSYSALHFVRGLPLQKGDKYEFPILTRAKMWILKAEVMGPEKIRVLGVDADAIKIKAETHFPGVLKKKGDILFWYSAGADHKLLKFTAKVKIGTVEGEITEEDFTEKK